MKYVSAKDRKVFAADLKKIYTAPDEKSAEKIRDEVEEKWGKKYPHATWRTHWDAIIPIFKFYTTNAIESLNATYRQSPQRSKWTMPKLGLEGELSVMFGERFPV